MIAAPLKNTTAHANSRSALRLAASDLRMTNSILYGFPLPDYSVGNVRREPL
jgi:hypothetical protein